MSNPFVHFELHTDDVGAAKTFYKKLFDWQLTDTPEFGGYTMLKAGDTGGGMSKKSMPEAPTQWLSYVGVASVKDTIAKAKKAGATIIVDYMPIGEMGAIGIFVDPFGASLGLWEASKTAPAAPPSNKKTAKKAAKKAPAKKAAAKPAAAKAAPKAAAKKAAKKK